MSAITSEQLDVTFEEKLEQKLAPFKMTFDEFKKSVEEARTLMFTSKQYDAVSFAAIRRGWYSQHPADSCKDILDSGNSKGDGEYWIDPEKNGNPIKVYCDMTADGGK